MIEVYNCWKTASINKNEKSDFEEFWDTDGFKCFEAVIYINRNGTIRTKFWLASFGAIGSNPSGTVGLLTRILKSDLWIPAVDTGWVTPRWRCYGANFSILRNDTNWEQIADWQLRSYRRQLINDSWTVDMEINNWRSDISWWYRLRHSLIKILWGRYLCIFKGCANKSMIELVDININRNTCFAADRPF